MAPFIQTDIKVYLNGYDVTTNHDTVALTLAAKELDITPYGANGGWSQLIAGMRHASGEFEGFTTLGTGGIEDILNNGQFVTSNISVWPTNSPVVGDPAYFFGAIQTKLEPMAGGVGDVAKFKASWSAESSMARGQVAHTTVISETATGSGSILNLGQVSATQKVYAIQHVTALAGSTASFTSTLQSSTATNFSNPQTRATFSALAVPGSQIVGPVAGPIVDPYWRLAWTLAGSNTASFAGAIAIN